MLDAELTSVFDGMQRHGSDYEYSQIHSLSLYKGPDFSQTFPRTPPSKAEHSPLLFTSEHPQRPETAFHPPTFGPLQCLELPTDGTCSGRAYPRLGALEMGMPSPGYSYPSLAYVYWV